MNQELAIKVQNLAVSCAQFFTKNHLNLATVESCTGGLLSHSFTNIPGSSEFFKGGFVVYSNEMKTKFAKVEPTILEQFGAVSAQTAVALARGVRSEVGSDISIAITGIAGPGGGSIEKPVGLVFICGKSSSAEIVREFQFSGGRVENKYAFTIAALKILLELVKK